MRVGSLISYLVKFTLDEQSAAILAVAMFVITIWTRRGDDRLSKWVAAASFELGLILGLFSLWQLVGGLTRGHFAGGYSHGLAIWHFERWLHLPSEVAVQRPVLSHPDIVQVANYFYDTAHLTLMVVFLIWLWLRHRDKYAFWRNVMCTFTAMSLLLQIIPVAPPRLINVHMVDTAMLYGQSVYAVVGSSVADIYAAMPSDHVGWSVLIAIAVIKTSPSKWRWLVVLHPIITIWVVIITANHYWMDGIVALALLGVAWLLVTWLRSEPTRSVLLRVVRIRTLEEPDPLVIAGVGDLLPVPRREEVHE